MLKAWLWGNAGVLPRVSEERKKSFRLGLAEPEPSEALLPVLIVARAEPGAAAPCVGSVWIALAAR